MDNNQIPKRDAKHRKKKKGRENMFNFQEQKNKMLTKIFAPTIEPSIIQWGKHFRYYYINKQHIWS